jgi:pimeloyl-ACP methyl ester carboxylesterase
MRLVIIILLLFSCSKKLDQIRKISSEEVPRKNFFIDPVAKEKLKKIDWKETFAKIFINHINQDEIKAPNSYPPFMKIKESIYYHPKPFETIYQDIMEEPTSLGIVEKKEKVLSNDRTLENLLRRKFSKLDFYRTGARGFVDFLEKEFEKEEGPIGNYFETSLGQSMMDILQDTIFIILPGFGNHLIQEMVFPDLVEEINEYYGRARSRPFFQDSVISYREYYGNPSREIKFDILQPMGKEIGSTFAIHSEQSKALKDWIIQLPSFYSDKNIVFIGYSMGATLALQILADFPEIRDRTRGIISLGGPLQGSTLADFLSKTIYNLAPSSGVNDLKEKLASLPGKLQFEKVIKSLSNNAFEKSLFFKNIIEKIPFLSENFKLSANQLFERIFYEDSRVILEGLYEEGTTHMLDWNLKYLNQEYFDRPIALFNLSFLANYKDFLIRGPIGEDGSKKPPEIIPQFLERGIDTKAFSLDLFSQILISFNNQETIPGGLTDSMVNWNNSKFPIFDPLPLKDTYLKPVLQNAYQTNDFLKSNFSYENFISLPRKEIFQSKGLGEMDFVDLGEVRGTHWSCFFRQVVRLPTMDEKLSHVHSFPHKALLKSIIETYGIYKLIRD